MIGLSTNRHCTSAARCLTEHDIGFVFRYYSEKTQMEEKVITPGEARILSSAEIKLAVVYQDRARIREDFSRELGIRNGAFAVQYAHEIGQPEGSTIFFAVDYDAGPSDLSAIKDYFNGVRESLPRYSAGIYGSGYICRQLREAGLVTHTWLAQSTGWRESSSYRDWDVKQTITNETLCTLPKRGWEGCVSRGASSDWCFSLEAPTAAPPLDIDALPLLRQNDTGEEVELLQRLLNYWISREAGILLLEDGIFGNKTRKAVRAFQASNVDRFGRPLVVDGLVGGLTWGALARISGDQPDPGAHPITGDANSPWWKQMPAVGFGGSDRARAALNVAVSEAVRGSGESGGNNMGPDVAKYLNGKTEPPSNWCAGFVSWCLRESGDMPIEYTVGARDILNQARRRGLLTFNDPVSTPVRPGDIVVWWRVSLSNWRGHAGFVHHVDQGTLFTIEGNKTSRVEGFDYSIVGIERLLGFVRI